MNRITTRAGGASEEHRLMINPDHAAIVIHIYGSRQGLSEGDAKYDDLEKRLAQFPVINVPNITLEGDANGAPHDEPSAHAKNSRASMCIGLSPAASDTISRRKPRMLSPTQSSKWTAINRVATCTRQLFQEKAK